MASLAFKLPNSFDKLSSGSPSSSSLLARRQHARGTPAMRVLRLALFLTASSVSLSSSAPISPPLHSPNSPSIQGDSAALVSSKIVNATRFEASFVPEPTTRGTVSLLTTCVLTMLISVWTVLHTNTPPLSQPRHLSLMTDILWALEGLLYPEELLSIALSQRAKALRFCRAMNLLEQSRKFGKLHPRNEVEENTWDSGGDWKEIWKSVMPSWLGGWKDSERTEYNEYRHWPLSMGFYATTGGFAYVDPNTYPPPPTFHAPPPATLGPTTILRLAQKGHFLDFHVREVTSRSNKALGGYIIIGLQTTFLLTSVLYRILSQRPIALIELHTLVHVLFALLTGLVWRGKLRGVTRPTIIPGRHLAGHEKLLRRGIPDETKMGFTSNWTVLVPLSALYAGLHASAWLFLFPTEAEQLLWRLAVIVTVAGGIVIAVLLGRGKVVPAMDKETWKKYSIFQMMGFAGVWTIFFVVTLARTVFVVESAFQVRALGKGALEVGWVGYVPHL